MALMDENGTGTTMLVQPAGFGGNNGGNGFMDGSGWWILLLFILLGGWGNNGFGGNVGGGNGVGGLYPWMNQSNQISEGFQNQLMNDNITSIRDGIYGINTQLCNGFAGVAQQLNVNQMADMERSFAVQSALQNCCCENRAGIADLKYTVATEACADRAAVTDALRDVIANQTANTQAILDKMCQQEMDALKERNADLRTQLNMANLSASQTAQTARILADNAMQTQALEQYLNPAPIPAYMVQNPNCCATPSYGCGCGCGCGM